MFLPADIAEPIRGDLQEEFGKISATLGARPAVRWYWRQVAATIFQTAAAAPLRTIGAVLAGQWMIGAITGYLTHAIQGVLDANRMYEVDPNAYLFWVKFPNQIGRMAVCAAVGAIVALFARRAEMPAVTTLALVQLAMFLMAAVSLIVAGRLEWWAPWFASMAPWNALCAGAIFGGGAAVHIRRRSVWLRSLAV
jgi:hypothetical protein